MKRAFAAALLLLLWLPAAALALTGQTYDTFDAYYQETLHHFNDYEGRHLIPLILAKRQSDEPDGRLFYSLSGDILTVLVTVDAAGVIEECEVRLAYPREGDGNANIMNDYYNLNYQCVAFQTAMDPHADVQERLRLAADIRDGLAAGLGSYARQLGAYTLTCTLVDGNMVVANFRNSGVPVETPVPPPTDTPAPGETPAPEETQPADAEDFVG
jgi:hypothetical protein